MLVVNAVMAVLIEVKLVVKPIATVLNIVNPVAACMSEGTIIIICVWKFVIGPTIAVNPLTDCIAWLENVLNEFPAVLNSVCKLLNAA